jgi:UPF0716 protein FxsA
MRSAAETLRRRACACRKEESGKEENLVLRRLPLIVGVVLVADFLLWGMLWHWFGWKLAIVETGATTVIGLAVILYYERRWSETVVKRIESQPLLLDGWSFEKILLLIAGIVLLIPGFATDLVGLLLLMPGVRRAIVHLVQTWT